AQLDDSLTRRSVASGFLLLGRACFSEWVLMASIPDFPSFLHIFSPFRPPSFCFSHLSGAPRLILHDCCPPDQELTLQQPRCAIRGTRCTSAAEVARERALLHSEHVQRGGTSLTRKAEETR